VVAAQDARLRETEAALALIRKQVAQSGSVDMARLEHLLRDAAMKDFAHILGEFLNNELSGLLKPPVLRPAEEFHSLQKRDITTIFGQITIERAYYHGPRGGRYPLDETLGLHKQYTPAVTQFMCWSGAVDGSFELASESLSRFAGLNIPGRQIQRIVNDLGPQASNWMHTRTPQKRATPVAILNIQADMTGIPMRPEELKGIKGKQPDGSAKTRQIKAGCVFTQSLDAHSEPQRDPFSSTYLTTFRDVVDFGSLLRSEAMKRGYANAEKTVFIGDGAEWIWNIADNFFRDAVQIVDFYHACEHLHVLCQILEPDESKCKTLFAVWRKRLRNNGLPKIMLETETRAGTLDQNQRQLINAELNYFKKNASRMTYKTFRSKGYFIGSGAIEGACRHIVAQRAKLSGMRWLCSGADNVLAFRSIIKSGLFNDYCAAQTVAA
jgi:hypothetical protein